MRRIVLSIIAAIATTAAQFWVATNYWFGILWQVSFTHWLVGPGPILGYDAHGHPMHEGTPVHLVAANIGLLMGVVFYSAAFYFLFKWRLKGPVDSDTAKYEPSSSLSTRPWECYNCAEYGNHQLSPLPMLTKRRILILIVACWILVAILGCSASDKRNDPVSKLKWLDTANPTEDAQRALKRNDIRLKAVCGYALIVPGIKDDEKYSIYEKKYGFDPIEGTSDNLQSDEHYRLNQLAYDYALKYNGVILKGAPK